MAGSGLFLLQARGLIPASLRPWPPISPAARPSILPTRLACGLSSGGAATARRSAAAYPTPAASQLSAGWAEPAILPPPQRTWMNPSQWVLRVVKTGRPLSPPVAGWTIPPPLHTSRMEPCVGEQLMALGDNSAHSTSRFNGVRKAAFDARSSGLGGLLSLNEDVHVDANSVRSGNGGAREGGKPLSLSLPGGTTTWQLARVLAKRSVCSGVASGGEGKGGGKGGGGSVGGGGGKGYFASGGGIVITSESAAIAARKRGRNLADGKRTSVVTAVRAGSEPAIDEEVAQEEEGVVGIQPLSARMKDVLDMKVSKQCKAKAPPFLTCREDDLVIDAVKKMNAGDVGSLVVIDDDNVTTDYPMGIITERDILKKVVAEGRVPITTRVKQVMTGKETLVVSTPDVSAYDCMRLMAIHKIRHIPIVMGPEQKLVGIVSIRDMVETILREKEDERRRLESYISGIY